MRRVGAILLTNAPLVVGGHKSIIASLVGPKPLSQYQGILKTITFALGQETSILLAKKFARSYESGAFTVSEKQTFEFT